MRVGEQVDPGVSLGLGDLEPIRHERRDQRRTPKDFDLLSVKFADQDGTPVAGMPTTTVHMQHTEQDGGTRMVMRSVFGLRDRWNRWTAWAWRRVCGSRSARWTPCSPADRRRRQAESEEPRGTPRALGTTSPAL